VSGTPFDAIGRQVAHGDERSRNRPAQVVLDVKKASWAWLPNWLNSCGICRGRSRT
jgi:hypothetical protein